MRSTTVYYTFNALLTFGMGATVTAYAPFLLSIGLTLGEVALVNGVYWFIVIAAELPTGVLADGRSRAWSLRLGCVFFAIGAFAYTQATGLYSAILGEGLIAIGRALHSGALQAWITDALSREGCKSELRRVFANDAIIRGAIMLIGGTVGALLGLISYNLIWLPLTVTGFIAFLFARGYMNRLGEPLRRVSEREALQLSFSLLRQSRDLVWVIGVMVIFGAVVSFNHFWSPYFESLVGQVGLSWVWAVIYLSFIPSGLIVRRFTIPVGQEAIVIVGSLIVTGVGLFALSIVSGLMLPLAAVVVHELGRGMFQPLTDTFVQHRVESSHRATFGSLQSFIGRAGMMITPLLVYFAIRTESNSTETITVTWFVTGSVLVLGAILLFLIRPRNSG